MATSSLLAPAQPELLCDECFDKLDEYVELELHGRRADQAIPGMRAHLHGCPVAAAVKADELLRAASWLDARSRRGS